MASSLHGDRQLLEEFLLALREEQAALTAGNTEALRPLADRKIAIARKIESQTSSELAPALRDTEYRMRRGEPAANAECAALHRMTREANELNRVNGVLIDQQLGQIRLSLSRIDPVSPTRQLYGRDGQGQGNGRGRSFGAA